MNFYKIIVINRNVYTLWCYEGLNKSQVKICVLNLSIYTDNIKVKK